MVSILRSFSQRFNKKRVPRSDEIDKTHNNIKPDQINIRKQFLCKIILLDGTDLNIALSRKAVGQEAYDKVFNHLDLDESDYFGLQYTDHYNVQHWLDPWKKIRKQISIGRICTFRFQVKFFSSEPSNLRSEFTRYQFFLQLKNDIRTGKMKCPKSSVIQMAALQLQSECGDYNPEQHNAAFVSEFRFHPEQDEEMEIQILKHWTQLLGRSPAEAEQTYLDLAKRLEFYGVELYEVVAKDGNRYMLGLTPSGVIVLDNSILIGLLFWHFMPQFSFHNRHITIVLEEHINDEIQQHTFVFELASQKASKHVWKRAVEYHTFYRMKRHRPHRKAADQIMRFRSTFEHRGRTEFENVNNPLMRRDQRSITFQRKPSQRYGPRQSHIQKLREEREKKNAEARQRQLENAGQVSMESSQQNSEARYNSNGSRYGTEGSQWASEGSQYPFESSRYDSEASRYASEAKNGQNLQEKQLSEAESRLPVAHSSQPNVLGSVQNTHDTHHSTSLVPEVPNSQNNHQMSQNCTKNELFGTSYLSKSPILSASEASTTFDAVQSTNINGTVQASNTTVSMVEVRDENDGRSNVNIVPRAGLTSCSRIPRYGMPTLPLYEEPADALPDPPETPKMRFLNRPKSINGYPKIHSTEMNRSTTSFGVEMAKQQRYPNRAVVMTQL
ncbi:unnamed protein product [Bursaphelenchus okinawaensis]|uniref:FERM domain-containing protein n=1 Tax=Bursaphelenchus okinawaensis TaxID=465554 RepID=A0A811KCG0_9BILA|nr:unnamed protein product [Bursaphelenchus okinawaensis]CAG9101641.1 unnamed protein product [Bursaphelenchus okinawaensis]